MKPCALLSLALLPAVLAAPLSAQERAPGGDERRRAAKGDEKERLGEMIEYRGALIVPPLWARGDGAPLFTFVQLSDSHHTAQNEWQMEKCLAHLRDVVQPDFVLITGDNISGDTPEHQRHYRDLLNRVLVDGRPGKAATLAPGETHDEAGARIPYFILTGDNDREHFADTFGSSQYSFTFGGLHFVCLGLDRDLWGDGIGDFSAETLAWLDEDLARHRAHPTFIANHENVMPPVFLGAPQLAARALRHRHVAGFLTGHLHYDLWFPAPRAPHVDAPGLGPNARHGFKVYQVQRTHLTVRTWELDGGPEGRYVLHPRKWQRIGFPLGTRAAVGNGPTRPGPDGAARFVVADYREREYRPVLDPTLQEQKDRCSGVINRALEFSARTRERIEQLLPAGK